MKRLKWVWNHLEEFLGGICLSGIVALVFINVLLRYVAGRPIGWSDELAGILFVWMVMFGLGAAARLKIHPNIDAVINIIPEKLKILVELVINIATISLLIYLTISSWKFTWDLGWDKLTGMLRIRYSFVYVSMPIGFFIMFVRITVHTVENIYYFITGKKLGIDQEPSAEEAV